MQVVVGRRDLYAGSLVKESAGLNWCQRNYGPNQGRRQLRNGNSKSEY